MTRLVLSLGSNIERDKHIRFAVYKLQQSFSPLSLSPVYATEAVGFNGPEFYNMVVVAPTQLPLLEIIPIIQSIETAAGRIRGEKSFESRNLDIDVLLYGEADLRAQGRNIPRDEILHAAYVLKPLADVLPEARHPSSGLSYRAMWAAFDDETQILRQVDFAFDI